MKDCTSLGLKVEDGRLYILDQTALPDKEDWLVADKPEDMIDHIYWLRTRGAPLIGVSAALCLARFAENGANKEEQTKAAQALRESRPTAVNLMNALDRMLPHLGNADALTHQAESIFDEDVQLCEGMANAGAALIEEGEALVTHCNTGGLATVGVGTALGVIRRAHEQGKKISVWVDETRPLLQGGRLTAWELKKLGIPYTIITDSMAALVLRDGRAQRALVGSDRIAMNGDFANKVGTYNLAVQCHHHKVPFHPVAPKTTIDPQCPTGKDIPIEERKREEVWGVKGSFGSVRWSPEGSPVYNPAFDVTPVSLLQSMVLDHGVLTQKELQAGGLSKLGL